MAAKHLPWTSQMCPNSRDPSGLKRYPTAYTDLQATRKNHCVHAGACCATAIVRCCAHNSTDAGHTCRLHRHIWSSGCACNLGSCEPCNPPEGQLLGSIIARRKEHLLQHRAHRSKDRVVIPCKPRRANAGQPANPVSMPVSCGRLARGEPHLGVCERFYSHSSTEPIPAAVDTLM